MRMPPSLTRLTVALGAGLIAIAAIASGAAAGPSHRGTVYTLSNAPGSNAVLAYDRAGDGSLTEAGSFPTGGAGTGAGLGNQGAIVLSDHGKLLFAVNAGSNDVSSLRVRKNGLELAGRAPSGGTQPISVTSDGKLLYVLNAGVPANISGFEVKRDGTLEALPGSTQPLSGADVGPAEIAFAPDGKTLIVTEKGTNSIDVFPVGNNGLAGAATTYASSGATPFGFDFDKRGNAIVSEAFGGAASALSSYGIDHGVLETISPSVVSTDQEAACWVVVSKNGRMAYTTNTGTGTVSSYAIGKKGELELVAAVAATVGGSPIDASISDDGKFLYVLNGANHAIDAFAIAHDGGLTAVPGGVSGLATGTNGLAAS